METIKYKDFVGSVEVNLKDKCIHGKILFINDLVTYESEELVEIETEFRAAVDDYIETCEELEIEPFKSFSGTFNVRIEPESHQKLALYATQKSLKINTVVKKAIDEYLDKPNQISEIHNHNTFNFSIEKPYKEFIPEKNGMERDADIIQFAPISKTN